MIRHDRHNHFNQNNQIDRCNAYCPRNSPKLNFGFVLWSDPLRFCNKHSQSFDDELGVADGPMLLNPEALRPNLPHRFDYHKSDGIGPGLFDFEALVVHEIGHVLGFISAVDRIDQAIRAGVTDAAIAPTTLDLFRFRSL